MSKMFLILATFLACSCSIAKAQAPVFFPLVDETTGRYSKPNSSVCVTFKCTGVQGGTWNFAAMEYCSVIHLGSGRRTRGTSGDTFQRHTPTRFRKGEKWKVIFVDLENVALDGEKQRAESTSFLFGIANEEQNKFAVNAIAQKASYLNEILLDSATPTFPNVGINEGTIWVGEKESRNRVTAWHRKNKEALTHKFVTEADEAIKELFNSQLDLFLTLYNKEKQIRIAQLHNQLHLVSRAYQNDEIWIINEELLKKLGCKESQVGRIQEVANTFYGNQQKAIETVHKKLLRLWEKTDNEYLKNTESGNKLSRKIGTFNYPKVNSVPKSPKHVRHRNTFETLFPGESEYYPSLSSNFSRRGQELIDVLSYEILKGHVLNTGVQEKFDISARQVKKFKSIVSEIPNVPTNLSVESIIKFSEDKMEAEKVLLESQLRGILQFENQRRIRETPLLPLVLRKDVQKSDAKGTLKLAGEFVRKVEKIKLEYEEQESSNYAESIKGLKSRLRRSQLETLDRILGEFQFMIPFEIRGVKMGSDAFRSISK